MVRTLIQSLILIGKKKTPMTIKMHLTFLKIKRHPQNFLLLLIFVLFVFFLVIVVFQRVFQNYNFKLLTLHPFRISQLVIKFLNWLVLNSLFRANENREIIQYEKIAKIKTKTKFAFQNRENFYTRKFLRLR